MVIGRPCSTREHQQYAKFRINRHDFLATGLLIRPVRKNRWTKPQTSDYRIEADNPFRSCCACYLLVCAFLRYLVGPGSARRMIYMCHLFMRMFPVFCFFLSKIISKILDLISEKYLTTRLFFFCRALADQ